MGGSNMNKSEGKKKNKNQNLKEVGASFFPVQHRKNKVLPKKKKKFWPISASSQNDNSNFFCLFFNQPVWYTKLSN